MPVHPEFFKIVSLANEQRDRERETFAADCQKVWRGGGRLDKEFLRNVGYKFQNVDELLKHHEFWAADQTLKQIDEAFAILVAGYEGLVEAQGRYHGILLHSGFGHSDSIQRQATVFAFQFSMAASSLVQSYRALKSVVPDAFTKVDQLRKEIFADEKLISFVQELRNCYGHSRIFSVNPHGNIIAGADKSVESRLKFDKKDLLIYGKWNENAKHFLKNEIELDAVEIFGRYFRNAERLYRNYESRSELSRSEGYREFKRIRQACRAVSQIIGLETVLQLSRQKEIDPYCHLSKYFSAEELERILCFERHSKEQVNYMILLRDPLGLCDDTLRDKLYKLFS